MVQARIILTRACLALVGAAALALVIAAPPVLAAFGHLQQAHAAIDQAELKEGRIDFGGAEASLDSARLLAVTAQNELESPLTFGARLIPVVRGNIEGSHALAQALSSLVLPLSQSLAQLRASDAPGDDSAPLFSKGRIDLGRVEQLKQPLETAAANARRAVVQARSADGLLLPPLRRALNSFQAEGTQVSMRLQTAAQAVEVLPRILGRDGPRTYFLMIQNGAEQRATGGFLGAFAVLKADKGQLRLEQFQANAALPRGEEAPAPSEEFADRYGRFGATRAWHNVNMTPDFPTAAQISTELWRRRAGLEIDGVMAIDALGLVELLKLTGPVSIPGLSEPVTPRNFVRLVLNEAYIQYPDKSGRTDVLLPVGAEVWNRLINAETSKTRLLAEAFGRSLASKNMQVWTKQEAELLKKLDVDGRLKQAKGTDYLMVVGQNAAGNKVDYYATRRIDYRVILTPQGKALSFAEVGLHNGAPTSGLPPYILGPFGNRPDPPGLNRSYLSFYTPLHSGTRNARLNSRKIGFESHTEAGLRVLSQFVEVPSGKSARLKVDLHSSLIRKGQYRLLMQHQPSLRPDSVNFSVQLPPGTVVRKMSPGMRIDGDRVRWSGRLTGEKEFFVSYGASASDRLKDALRKAFA